LQLQAGERITLTPGIYHAFWAAAPNTILGEVSTANDDANDNFFVDPNIGRFPGIEEDAPATLRLISEIKELISPAPMTAAHRTLLAERL
jgi:D-lyxose ketol-isomerase